VSGYDWVKSGRGHGPRANAGAAARGVWLWAAISLSAVGLTCSGCLHSTLRTIPADLRNAASAPAPSEPLEWHRVDRGQLAIHTTFYLPPTHPLIEEMVNLRADVLQVLRATPSTEPIQVYLFRNPRELAQITQRTGDPILQRRAYFLQTPDALRVYAAWTYDVAVDLRHELTHAYIHSVQPQVPLWLDEGLAEYFEVPRAEVGRHPLHSQYLRQRQLDGGLDLSLARLESLRDPATFAQADYAQSWLWVRWLLSRTETAELLAEYFANLPKGGEPASLLPRLAAIGALAEVEAKVASGLVGP
jgi:hypothetical protein